jgi:FMN-dependent oxidoreductase (nitrilotriacetate monooxygenase family)
MTERKTLHIGLSLSATWLSGDAWRRPDSNIEATHSIDFPITIAKQAEAAKLDFVFRPDALFLDTERLRHGPAFTSLDATLVMAAIARETSRIGLLTTISTTFLPPYVVARQLLTLHRISQGRAGWNIVTALDGHQNFGLDKMPSADERYQRAAEFTEVVRRLWASFPEAALKIDRERGFYADPALVQPIDHRGPNFTVKGPLNLVGWDAAPLPLVQAGASPAGRAFAASVADAVFASTPDIDAARELRQDLRQRAVSHGRKASDIRLLPGLSLYLAATRREAQDLFRATHASSGRARRLARVRELVGLDLSDWPTDRPVTSADLPVQATPRSRTHSDLLRRLIINRRPSVEELLLAPEVIGSAHWQVIGTADDAAAEIGAWAQAGAIDGFVAAPGGSNDSLHRVLAELIPLLVERKLFRRDYLGDSFFAHLQA